MMMMKMMMVIVVNKNYPVTVLSFNDILHFAYLYFMLMSPDLYRVAFCVSRMTVCFHYQVFLWFFLRRAFLFESLLLANNQWKKLAENVDHRQKVVTLDAQLDLWRILALGECVWNFIWYVNCDQNLSISFSQWKLILQFGYWEFYCWIWNLWIRKL